MDFEVLRTVTPYITLCVTLMVGAIGWGVRLLIQDTARHLNDLRRDFGLRLERIERGVEQLEAARLADHKEAYDRFVSKDWYFRTLSRTEQALRQLNDRLHRYKNSPPAGRRRKTG